jgi:hypothetical protein
VGGTLKTSTHEVSICEETSWNLDHGGSQDHRSDVSEVHVSEEMR